MNKEDLRKIKYSSWQGSNEWTEEELDFILGKECVCGDCEKGVEELNDFPNLSIEKDELLCEYCYTDRYFEICPICENHYSTEDGESDFSVTNEEDGKEENKTAGIYKNNNLLIPININNLKKIDCGENCSKVYSDHICNDCVCNLVRKDNYMKSHGHGTPCILIKKYENNKLFENYSKQQFKKSKQKLIHKRITFRGLIEIANKRMIN